MITAKVIKNTQLRGLQDLARRLRKAEVPRVLVGVPAGATEDDGTSTATIAAAHEFGVPPFLPERSFLRAGIRENADQFKALNRENLAKIAEGKMDERTALGQLGAKASGAVKKYIREGSFEPLKPETVRRKGSSKPLIDTGHMIQSITWQFDGTGEAGGGE